MTNRSHSRCKLILTADFTDFRVENRARLVGQPNADRNGPVNVVERAFLPVLAISDPERSRCTYVRDLFVKLYGSSATHFVDGSAPL